MRAAGARITSLFAIPALFALGGIAARVLLQRSPPGIAQDLRQPLVVVTAWGGFGLALWFVLASTVTLCAAALLLAARRSTGTKRLPLSVVILVAALTQAAALSWPVVFSSDVYAYAAYGELASRGLDPYVPAAAHAGRPLIDAAAWQWGGHLPVCVYGPVFVGFARALVSATRAFGAGQTLAALRVVGALAFSCSIPLFAGLARRLIPANAERATLLYGLNPVALWVSAEGHNDALALAVVLAGAFIYSGTRARTGAVLIALAAALKASALVGAGVVALDAWFERDPLRRRRTLVGLGLSLAVVAALTVPAQWPALRALELHGRYLPRVSLQALVGIGPALVAAGVVMLAGVRVFKLARRSGATWLAGGAWLGLPNPQPWYALWILPAACLGGGRVAAAVWLTTIFAVLRYLPDAFGNMSSGPAAVISALLLTPLALGMLVPSAGNPLGARRAPAT